MKNPKKVIALSALLLAIAVLLGAFGAHGLEKNLSAKIIKTYQTGVTYFYYHSFGLFLYALACKLYSKNISSLITGFFLTGILIFSGGCVTYALTGIKAFAMIVPLGGLSFFLAWLGVFKNFIKD